MQTVPIEGRFRLIGAGRRDDRVVTMAREVRDGLGQVPRSIPPKYFYDEAGSRLFDAICSLPEYYLTRAERALLVAHADRIVATMHASALVEIGSGMARKTGPLIVAMRSRVGSPLYVPFDIAPGPIRSSAAALLAAFPTLRVRGVIGDFTRDCERLTPAVPASEGPRLFAFLGSTMGNLDEREAQALVGAIAGLMTEDDRFLLGVDLVKDPEVLSAAYNDAQGVTAAFNKNVLRVIARELDGQFDDSAFEHLAFYDGDRECIEMHLVSQKSQELSLRAADFCCNLTAGERVLTEISRKFTRPRVESLLAGGGMKLIDWNTSAEGREQGFALCVAKAIGQS